MHHIPVSNGRGGGTAQVPLSAQGHPERLPGAAVVGRRCMHIRLRIEGLTRAAETVGVERHLVREPGVIHVMVNPLTAIAYILYDPDRTSRDALWRCITDAGYVAGER